MRLTKKNIMRVLVICLVCVLAGSAAMTTFSSAALTSGKSGKSTWVYMGAGKDGKAYKSTNTSNKQPKYTVKVGSTKYVGYCINPDKGWGSGTKMTSRTFASSTAMNKYSAYKKELLSYVLLFGYNSGVSAPYGNSNDFYAATQTLVWQVLEGHVVMDLNTGAWTKNNTSDKSYSLIKGHSYGVKCYDHIKKQISAHVRGASFASGSVEQARGDRYIMKYNYKNKNWTCTLGDSTGTFSYAKTAGSTGLTMTRSGDKYTFSMSSPGTAEATLMSANKFTTQSAMVFDSGSSSTQSVALGATDTRKMYVAFQTEEMGKGRIIKLDASGHKMSGFNFRVTNAQNGYDQVWTTGEDGTITEDLYPGIYKVQEVLTEQQLKANWLEADPQELEVVAGDTSSVEIVNVKNDRARLKIVKAVTDGGPVSGFKFKVTGLQSNEKPITVNDVIEEACPVFPDGYQLEDWQVADNSPIDAMNYDMAQGKTGSYTVKLNLVMSTVRADGNDAENTAQEVSSQSTSVASTSAGVASANAQEESDSDDDGASDNDGDGNGDSDDNGEDNNQSDSDNNGASGNNDNNTPSSETSAPTTNSSSDSSKETKTTLSIHITTVVNGEELAEPQEKTEGGIKYYDFQWDGVATPYDEEFVTDKNGQIVIDDIHYGAYTIREVMTDDQAKRYREPAEQSVTIDEGNAEDLVPFVFTNVARDHQVKVIKKCVDNNISGLEFKITGTTAWGEAIETKTAVTDEEGVADFGKFLPGDYVAEEVNQDLEKYLPCEPQHFKITGDEEDGAVITLNFTNKPIDTLEISKQDGTTGEELPGAKLLLTDKETGEVIDEWTSTDTPHMISGLEFGRVVVLRETLPPEGFATASQVEITVGSQDKVVMVDELTQVVISKQDAAGSSELEGASLRVIDPDTDEVMDQWISGGEPHMIEGLVEGKEYTLIEDQAPIGYKIANSINFVVGRDSEVIMLDEHIPGVATGDVNYVLPLLVLGLLAFGIAMVITVRRRLSR